MLNDHGPVGRGGVGAAECGGITAVFVGVDAAHEGDLLEICEATRGAAGLAGLGEGGEEDRDQHRDDGDDDQEFDECEGTTHWGMIWGRVRRYDAC